MVTGKLVAIWGMAHASCKEKAWGGTAAASATRAAAMAQGERGEKAGKAAGQDRDMEGKSTVEQQYQSQAQEARARSACE